MLSLDALRKQIESQNPTKQQGDAIFSDALEFLLRAAPGSGKTWTSSRRFMWRGANWNLQAGGLALLSFTNAAIREFQEAAIEVGRRDLLSDPNYVGTFDAFVERFVLAPFGHLAKGIAKRPKLFVSPRPGDRKNKKLHVWAQLSGGRKLQIPTWEIVPYPDSGEIAYKASRALGGAKLNPAAGDSVDALMAQGFYTHSQRVYWACRLLIHRPHIAARIAKRFPEIIIDEAQDTSVWLLLLLTLLRDNGTKITLVGDPDQCIYEFSMADATSLPSLKEEWQIPEKPLSKSFRCNNEIAYAARNIGGNQEFVGRGNSGSEYRGAFVVREPLNHFSHSVSEFQKALSKAGIPEPSSAIICRGHRQLETIHGQAKYESLQGVTKELARASFFRDCQKDYKHTFEIVQNAIREIAQDSALWNECGENPDGDVAQRTNLSLWRFAKSANGLPAVNLSGSEWISKTRQNVGNLLNELGINNAPNLNLKIRRNGLDSDQIELPLFEAQSLFPPIRHDIIHQVKGESIDAVLVLASAKFWNSVVTSVLAGESSEDRRLAYVAMTRARHLLVVGLPKTHFDKYAEKWTAWGFGILQA